MCIFAGSVERVSKTRIIVAPTSDGRQFTAYSNSVVSRSTKNAMILPVPTGGEITFVNLENSPDLMQACENLFPKPDVTSNNTSWGFGAGFSSKSPLPVEKVGGYSCSIVPSLADFDRINPDVFVLPKNTAELLKKTYPEGYSFIVCQFEREVNEHPIAYTHPMRDGKLFIPTFHGHDGGDDFERRRQSVRRGPANRQNFVYAGGSPNFDERTGRSNDNGFYPAYITGDNINQKKNPQGVIHQGVNCDVCNASPLVGTRYKCMHCANFDACEGCRRQHDNSHVFAEFVHEADQDKLWHVPVFKDSVYKEGKKPKEAYDHTIYILNGTCDQTAEEYTELRSQFVDAEYLLRTFLKLNVFIAQRLSIQGNFPNRDYSATVRK